ncbi:MAG: glycosyltransferase [Candidatus Azobacteroides sp.]|nr:glycosyltransferase [Candidatus Azobacteroides sp.]
MELTVIIPFLNEGIEIANTLQSIRSTAGDTVDILLINDCSTDEFDYESCALQFNARYHKNKERIGVAASRDIGVSMITTPYFLLLDGHMRFYDNCWVARIIEELKPDEKVLLCCQTKVLHKENNQINISETKAFGAYINLVEEENLLNVAWNDFEAEPNTIIEDIPCILGAAYACSREYWQYLKGLSGLMYYGSDEAYISLKVWLNGGKCRLLKDVVVGHIYRTQYPYKVENIYILYNKLLIAELLLPNNLKKALNEQCKTRMDDVFVAASHIIMEREREISELKQYYRSILSIDFDSIYQWNANILQKHNNIALQRIAGYLMQNSNEIGDPGLLYGKMGIVIFFARYAQYTSIPYYEKFAETLLDEIYDMLGRNSSIDFQSGLCGIGWGIEYLVQNGLMEGNTDEILEDIDKKVMDLDMDNMDDMSLEKGLCGILHYVYARIVSAYNNQREAPFQKDFLNRLSQKLSRILQEKQETEHSSLISRFLSFINENIILEKSIRLNHIIILPAYFDSKFEQQSLGLRFGCAGVGLKKMRIN